MALPPVMVPNAPGVPPVPRLGVGIDLGGISLGGSIGPGGISIGGGVNLGPISIGVNLGALMTGDVAGIFQGYAAQTYGIFSQAGAPVVICDSILTMEYKQEFILATFPLEQGAFNTYDKVKTPYDARIRCATGGGPAARQAFLASIDAIIGDVNLYSVVTPDKVYTSCNLTHQDYKRSATSGAGLVQVDIFLEEVRVTATASTSSTKSNLPASTPNYNPANPPDAQPNYNGTQNPVPYEPGGSEPPNQGPELVGSPSTPSTPSAPLTPPYEPGGSVPPVQGPPQPVPTPPPRPRGAAMTVWRVM